MGREIRRVPKNWDHPKKDGGYKSVFDGDFEESYFEWERQLKEWFDEYVQFEKGKIFKYGEEIYSKENGCTYEDYAGEPESPPNPYHYMPKGEWYQLFENVSEGTPLSPPFETENELIDWLINNKDFWGTQWSAEAAKNIVESKFALSGIMTGGKVYRPEEQHMIKD